MCFQILTHALHPPCRSLHSANSLSRVHPVGALTLTASVSYMVSQECTNKKNGNSWPSGQSWLVSHGLSTTMMSIAWLIREIPSKHSRPPEKHPPKYDGVVPQVKSMNTSQSGPKDGAPIQGHRNEPRGAWTPWEISHHMCKKKKTFSLGLTKGWVSAFSLGLPLHSVWDLLYRKKKVLCVAGEKAIGTQYHYIPDSW